MSNTVDKVIAVAMAEEGYLEKSRSAYLADKTVLDRKTDGAGSDNYTKYGRDMHKIYPSVMDFPAYWCDCFVDWCFYKAYGVANAKGLLGGNFDDYTVASKELYVNKGAYRKSNPKVGDQIFFKNSTRVCHTGLVYKVDSKYVYTIEGNTSGASGVIANGGGVVKKKYSLTNSRIDGYGRPKYDDEVTTPTTSSEKKTGYNRTVKWNGKVYNCGSLNVRKGAGKDNPNLVSYPTIAKDTVVGVCDETKDSNGNAWYYININGKYGFVSAKYIKKA